MIRFEFVFGLFKYLSQINTWDYKRINKFQGLIPCVQCVHRGNTAGDEGGPDDDKDLHGVAQYSLNGGLLIWSKKSLACTYLFH